MSTDTETQPHVGCSIGADGRITFDLPPGSPEGQRLLLGLRPKKGQPEETVHVLDFEPAGERRCAVLDADPVLAEGRWDVYLLPEPGAERQRLRAGLRDLRALVDGHRRHRPSPVAVRIPYMTKDGHLAVRAWLRTTHVEAEAVDVTGRSMTVRARLHGASLQEGAVVSLGLRGAGATARTVEPRAEDEGRSLSFTVDYAELAGGTPSGAGVWDVFVRPAAQAPRIRVGRLLDDLADRKEIVVYPTADVGGAALRPYYTVDNDLSVEVGANA
ncbi:hypothetical protein ACFVU0_37875 [Streptomyces sp. NPDC058122]|uniref:hypothetical protein n=1 Tax=Streptomyces sp. NPDC058122 TaxID=3346349 RepID=UPI0036F099F6